MKRKELTKTFVMISNCKIPLVSMVNTNISALQVLIMLFISFLWIWKGVSATSQSGRCTLSYPRGRYGDANVKSHNDWYYTEIHQCSLALKISSVKFQMSFRTLVFIFACWHKSAIVIIITELCNKRSSFLYMLDVC